MVIEAPLRAALYMLALAALCGATAAHAESDHRRTLTGVASWYGIDHQGKPTASGEAFDRNELTAAHRSLPLGTLLRVTNPSNGKQVVVRVNDRGPFVRGRILDLSERAARTLGIVRRGMARVVMEIADAAALSKNPETASR